MNDYISLTRAVEQSQDRLGLSNWQQLFELAQGKNLPIYYQLAYSSKKIYFADFPLGNLLRGSGVGGGKGLRHYTTYNDCSGNRVGSKNNSPLLRENLGNNGYSRCMDIAIQECGKLSFSHFFNDELFKREIDRCIQHYKTPPLFLVNNESEVIIPRPPLPNVAPLLFIADKYRETLGELSKYIDASGAVNDEKLKSDCLANVESHNFFFLFADHSSITDTADNFYLLRADFETLGDGNIDIANEGSNPVKTYWEEQIANKLPNLNIDTPAYNRLIALLQKYEVGEFKLPIEDSQIQITRTEVYKKLSGELSTDSKRTIDNFCNVTGLSFKRGSRAK